MKLKFFVFSLFLTAGLFICPETNAQFETEMISMNLSGVSPSSGNSILKIDADKIKTGCNPIASNPRTGNQLCMVATKRGKNFKIHGFEIKTKRGRVLKLKDGEPTTLNLDIGCPDGWNSRWICYTHPIYNETICFFLCTPSELTLKLPQTW